VKGLRARELLVLAWSNISVHKFRSVLTTLGIVFGVATVVTVVMMSSSVETYFISRFTDLFAPDTFSVAVGEVRSGTGASGFFIHQTPMISERDLSHIRRIPGVKEVYASGDLQPDVTSPIVFRGKVVSSGMGGFRIVAISSNAFTENQLLYGRVFRNGKETVVTYDVAKRIAKELGNEEDVEQALGKTVELNFVQGGVRKSVQVRIVGVLKEIPFVFQNAAYLNLEDYYDVRRTVPGSGPVRVYRVVGIRVNSVTEFDDVKSAVLEYLRSSSDAEKLRRRDAPDMGFITISAGEVTNFIREQVQLFASFVLQIGSFALLVGSIGIANIMLVNVTERTKEIGVLRAIGARRRDVLNLFLTEAGLIGAIGATIAVPIGILFGVLFLNVGPFSDVRLPIAIRPEWIPLAVMIGALVGVVSGVYPAWRASRIDPVQALKYE
jgi:putative ABC transport system permease protein